MFIQIRNGKIAVLTAKVKVKNYDSVRTSLANTYIEKPSFVSAVAVKTCHFSMKMQGVLGKYGI